MKPAHLIAAYVTIAIVTFGYAAATHKPDPCTWCIVPEEESKAHIGILAGVAWPLYWTWEAFERILK